MSDCPKCNGTVPDSAKFCPDCGAVLGADALAGLSVRVEQLEEQLADARRRLSAVAAVVDHNSETADARLDAAEALINSSDVYNTSFWARAWAIWGHALVPGLVIGGIVYLVMFVLLGLSQ